MNIKGAFGAALRKVRQAKELTQEDFGLVSSRVHVSAIERGNRGITLEKTFQLAKVMKVNPVTLVAIAYLRVQRSVTAKELLATLKAELDELG